jgi:hypothetical protein
LEGVPGLCREEVQKKLAAADGQNDLMVVAAASTDDHRC